MHLTLHLTDACNLSCRYCYVKQDSHFMSPETAKAAVDLAASLGKRCGIAFFGGEPLLCRDLIEETVEYGESLKKAGKGDFYYKITTNGILLDESFLEFSRKHEIFIALSHDGIQAAQDQNRIFPDGSGTFGLLEEKAKMLLAFRPYAPVMMTVAPNAVSHYAEGIKYLFDLGFRYLICTLDYSGAWTEAALRELEKQYRLLAKWYREATLAEEKFYFSPFEVKISSWIHKSHYRAERCELGKKQISAAPDGTLYPCVQFVGDARYSIGSVFLGIDEARRRELYLLNETEREPCSLCALKNRCSHTCACLNMQATGDLRTVSPVLCAHERMVLPIADRLAEDLYKRRSALFLQKQYNDMFPLLSLTEDRIST